MVYDIMGCSVNCSDVDHYRHPEFLKDYQLACSKGISKYGLGYKAFNEEWVTNRARDILLEIHSDPKRPYTKRKFQIKNLKNCAFAGLFEKNSMLAQNCILHVATKEVLVFLRISQKCCPYEVANKICQESKLF